MASTTPKNQRKCLTNDEKQKLGFCRKITDAFSINSMTLHLQILSLLTETCPFFGLNIPNIVIIKHTMKEKSSW